MKVIMHHFFQDVDENCDCQWQRQQNEDKCNAKKMKLARQQQSRR